jgi:antagonist of KipI
MTVTIQQAAVMMTVQDGGRRGFQRFGMPESGPMDGWAFQAANRLVGNPTEAACLEIGFSSAEVYLEQRSLLALCGAGFRLFVNQRELPLWMAFLVRTGDTLRLEKTRGGNWVYLAAAGGIQSPVWMGSRSVYPAAGIGKLLAAGDRLPLHPLANDALLQASYTVPQAARPAYAPEPRIRVVPGPHSDRFEPASRDAFLAPAYQVSLRSDRMGYRLTGPALMHKQGPDLVSQGMIVGEIQVPGDGQPIVMMPDHPTTGGYACIATVIQADLPLLAQSEPGVGTLQFTPVSVTDAHKAWGEVVEKVSASTGRQEEAWSGL